MKNRNILWVVCCVVMGITIILTFTPLVIPQGVRAPRWLGMPYTLWMGIVVSLWMGVLVFLGTLVHPGKSPQN
ncbi:MAG: hypothetical protein HC892_12720 [Saprospiraceae bacterium]|nr:hypothetical protein [Saprospiraceae bacterium]